MRQILLHLHGFVPFFCGKYHGAHSNFFIAAFIAHSNLDGMTEWSILKAFLASIWKVEPATSPGIPLVKVKSFNLPGKPSFPPSTLISWNKVHLQPLLVGERSLMLRGHCPVPVSGIKICCFWSKDTPGETALVSVETNVAETLTEWPSPGARRRWSDWRSGNSEGWPRKSRNPEKGVKTDSSLTLNTSQQTLKFIAQELPTCPCSGQEWPEGLSRFQRWLLMPPCPLGPWLPASPSRAGCTRSPSGLNDDWKHNRLQSQWWQEWRYLSSSQASPARCISSTWRLDPQRGGQRSKEVPTSREDGTDWDRPGQVLPGIKWWIKTS